MKGKEMEKIIKQYLQIKLWGNDLVRNLCDDQRGDVPGWVLVLLMTTGLVTGIWTLAAPRLTNILNNSLNNMNNIR
jgi:hypothetical protein